MQLVRNTTEDGSCKYGLIRFDKMRKDGISIAELEEQLGPLRQYLEIAGAGSEDEAFVIKLKDPDSPPALGSYGAAAFNRGDAEMAAEVLGLLERSGKNSPFCKEID